MRVAFVLLPILVSGCRDSRISSGNQGVNLPADAAADQRETTAGPTEALDAGMADELGGRLSAPVFVQPEPLPAITAAERVQDLGSRAFAVAVVRCVSLSYRPAPEPVPAVTLAGFEIRQAVFGSFPTSFHWQGGTLPDRMVLNSSAPQVEVGGEYLAFAFNADWPSLQVMPIKNGNVWVFTDRYEWQPLSVLVGVLAVTSRGGIQ